MKSDMFAADLGLVLNAADGSGAVEFADFSDYAQGGAGGGGAQQQGGAGAGSRVQAGAPQAVAPQWMQQQAMEIYNQQQEGAAGEDDGSFESRVAQFENFLTDWQSTYYGHSFVGHAQATAMHEDILAQNNPKLFGNNFEENPGAVQGVGAVGFTQQFLNEHPMTLAEGNHSAVQSQQLAPVEEESPEKENAEEAAPAVEQEG